MELMKTKLNGCVVIKSQIFSDNRGWFTESYSKREFNKNELEYDFVQDNYSHSNEKGILRGIHVQNYPHAQAKLVRCTKGRILDVAVDLRPNSETYKQWFSIELSEDNYLQLLIPRGFGHGFLTLTDNVEVQYKVDNFYNSDSDRSIRFDDPELKIDWGIVNPILSNKDRLAKNLCDVDLNFGEEV
ncbi:dTDP-4-dehydrorhamnose 3,5-epimerase [Erysipelothrix rhusiopathiae]|uniref:dTDP-4-dehydrorhamnose 3,5-epimerase n=1 Tax=Erysipelothrix rhusiopathiae TaxID=1648 RepID=A0A6S6I560_ERYRH|nr:dTDP-4-dehydrorhamnose 3,5-epimerase [Erysipelothrix rhusiopathiae]BCB22705.1 dTDP-4-dehydrorhamnose 3,5-epimerase family protein [Erysipelothrix rhusiopathiae]